MMNRFRTTCEAQSTTAALFITMLLYKLLLDVSYWRFLIVDTGTYRADFSPLKYAVGLVFCIVLFATIRHTERKVSTYFLYMLLLMQFVPITTVYALANDNSEYYFVLFLSLLLCQLLVGNVDDEALMRRNMNLSRLMLVFCVGLIILVSVIVVRKNGVPSLTALNIYQVYELRRSGAFQIERYANYLFSVVTKVLLPFAIAMCLCKKEYALALLPCGLMILFYLYSGNKTILFAVPLVVVVTLWSRRQNCYREMFFCFCIGIALLILINMAFPAEKSIPYSLYDLFGRRTLIVPANNKFKYFDYFSSRPKMGLGGVFPRWLVPIQNPYENIMYSYDISAIYYGKPEMNSNTGFLAEGFMRFGHAGTVGVMLLLAWLLKLVDRLQERAGYSEALGLCVYMVFSLADAHLLDSLLFGYWTVLLVILLVYQPCRHRTGKKGCIPENASCLAKTI